MLVEPESLCWLTGRMVTARDGATWAQEFARFPALKAVVRDDGSGLGKGLKLERARRRVAHQGDLEDTLDVFHTLREGGRALRTTWAGVTRALDRADVAQKDLDQRGRHGQSRTGHATQTNRLWRRAERLWDQALAAETAWKQIQSAFEFFTPEGRFNDRSQAEAVVAAALPHLSGSAWAKTRRLLLRRESFTFLDQAVTAVGRSGVGSRGLVGAAGPGRITSPALATVGNDARVGRDPGLGVGPHGPVGEDATRLARSSTAGSPGAARGVACEQPGGMRQQRGADAASAAPQDDAGSAGPEAAVLEPSSLPHRPPQGSDAVRPAGPETARPELLGVPQADPGGIAKTTVRTWMMHREIVPYGAESQQYKPLQAKRLRH